MEASVSRSNLLRERAYAAYQARLQHKAPLRVNRSKELAEAKALIERVEARRREIAKTK